MISVTDAATLAHIVRTGRNGVLDDMKPDDVTAIVDRVAAQQRIVLHFHGGLNSRADGELTAGRWLPIYQDRAGADPIFFVWESGFLDTIFHNLDEIAQDEIFKRLLKWVLRYAVGKVGQDEGARAAGIISPADEREADEELGRRRSGDEPYDHLAPQDVQPLAPEEEDAFARDVESDAELQASLEAALAAALPETQDSGTRGVTLRSVGSTRTLLDPGVFDEMRAEAGPDEGARGLVSAAFLAKKAIQVLRAVIGRYRGHTDSGIYPTVLEEVLRAFYLANAGGAIWQAMKKETADTFVINDEPRGGRLVLDRLAARLAERDGTPPEITLVGHSTGAVFIDNFLTEVARGVVDGSRPWPKDVTFQVVLLAPAATFVHMTDAWPAAGPLVRRLRMFTMDDVHERLDHLVGPLYPRSLLYFVSGVVERNRDQDSAVAAVVGLDRYYGDTFATRPDLASLRTYLNAEQRIVTSPSPPDAPVGRRTNALGHTKFNTDELVAESVVALIDGTAV